MLKSLRISKVEFVFLMASLMAITALSIDAVLPSLGFMANDFGASSSEIQLIITILFVGFVLGHIIFGPLSDRFWAFYLLSMQGLFYLYWVAC